MVFGLPLIYYYEVLQGSGTHVSHVNHKGGEKKIENKQK